MLKALGPQFCIFSLSSKDGVGQDLALLCLVVLKIVPFAWTVAQAFLQVQTFTLPLRAPRFFSQDYSFISLFSLAFGGERNAQEELKDLDTYDNFLLLFVMKKSGAHLGLMSKECLTKGQIS